MGWTRKSLLSKIEQQYPESRIDRVVDFYNRYIVNLVPKSRGEAYLQFVAIDKDTGKITGNIPSLILMENDDFREKFQNSQNGSRELSHSGIPGMKWGVRNGPPYPLEQHSNAELTRAGNVWSYRDTSNDVQRAARIAMGELNVEKRSSQLNRSVGTEEWWRATLGTKAGQIEELDARAKKYLSDNGRSIMRVRFADIDKDILSEKDAKRIEGPHTAEDDLVNSNPNPFSNPNLLLKGSNNNCTLTSLTYDLRRRGYDVIANASESGDIAFKTVSDWYKNAKMLTPLMPGGTITEASSWAASEYPDGSRGIFIMTNLSGGVGHCVAFEVKDGKTHFMDAQSGKEYTARQLDEYDMSSKGSMFMRTDNLQPNWNAIGHQHLVLNSNDTKGTDIRGMSVADRWKMWLEESTSKSARAYRKEHNLDSNGEYAGAAGIRSGIHNLRTETAALGNLWWNDQANRTARTREGLNRNVDQNERSGRMSQQSAKRARSINNAVYGGLESFQRNRALSNQRKYERLSGSEQQPYTTRGYEDIYRNSDFAGAAGFGQKSRSVGSNFNSAVRRNRLTKKIFRG